MGCSDQGERRVEQLTPSAALTNQQIVENLEHAPFKLKRGML